MVYPVTSLLLIPLSNKLVVSLLHLCCWSDQALNSRAHILVQDLCAHYMQKYTTDQFSNWWQRRREWCCIFRFYFLLIYSCPLKYCLSPRWLFFIEHFLCVFSFRVPSFVNFGLATLEAIANRCFISEGKILLFFACTHVIFLLHIRENSNAHTHTQT